MKCCGTGVIIVCLIGFVLAQQVYAHCDTISGPVIMDAKKALNNKDITPVLKWVKEDAEPEIRSAFQKALTGKKKDREVSEMKFFETLVRVHRSGEGASFSGLKPADSIDPVLIEADKALETGTVDGLNRKLSEHLSNSVQEKFNRAYTLSKNKDKSVAAGREYVDAYVDYTHYIEGLHTAIQGKMIHHAKGAQNETHNTLDVAKAADSHQEETMINVLEGIPYQEQKMGNRKLVDEKPVMIMQLALKPGQSVPQHPANSNVHILVVRGEVVISLNGKEIIAKEGSLVPVAHKTPMSVVNKSDKDASFLNIKTPNPSVISE